VAARALTAHILLAVALFVHGLFLGMFVVKSIHGG